MHHLLVAVGAAALVAASAAASQSITIGSGAAEACYEAARERRTSQTALDECDQAISGVLSSPDLVATHVNRGILHALKKDYSKALSDYDRAIKLDPDEPEAFLNKGLLLLRLESRDAEALRLLNLALAYKTRMPALAYFARGIAHEELGQTAAAYRDYRQAAALSPKWDLPIRELRRFRKKADFRAARSPHRRVSHGRGSSALG